jgi:hypothetical protein
MDTISRYYRYDDGLTTARDRREQAAAEAYNVAFELEDDQRRREWEAEFDAIPYHPNTLDIHAAVLKRLRDRV